MSDLVGILLFILGSFSSVYNYTHCVALNDRLFSREMERMRKEVVMAKFELLSWNFLQVLRKTTGTLNDCGLLWV